MTQIIAYKYGLLPPLDWGEDCEEQLRLQVQFWNRLVEIEHGAQARFRGLFMADPRFGRIDAERNELQQRIDTLFKARQEARGRFDRGASEEITSRIEPLLSQRHELWEAQKRLRNELKPGFRRDIAGIEGDRRAAVKRARQQSGLWWCNYNAVRMGYERARSQVLRKGRTLRPKVFNGSGRLTIQFSKGASIDELFAGTRSQLSIAPAPPPDMQEAPRGERRRHSRTQLTATIYTDGERRRLVTWPMVMHRPVPRDARIKEVVIKRARESDRFRWSVVFTCSLASERGSRPSRRAAGISLGWRKLDDAVRIATVCDATRASRHILLPARVLKRAQYLEEVQAELARALNVAYDYLERDWGEHEVPPGLQELHNEAVQARSASALGRLVIAWRDHSQYLPALKDALEEWRRTDKRRRQETSNLRRKMRGERRQHYQMEARSLAQDFGLLALRRLNLARVARRTSKDMQRNPLPDAARRLRFLAALSEFVDALQKQCAKSGSVLAEVPVAVTTTCHVCGAEQGAQVVDLERNCESCHARWDQDVNAARNSLLWCTRSRQGTRRVPRSSAVRAPR